MDDLFSEDIGSNRASIDFFLSSFLLTVGTVAGLLFIIWSTFEQLQSYKNAQGKLLNNSVASVALEISHQIEERSRTVTAIANDHRQTLETIIAEPENELQIIRFERLLKTYFPEMYAFTLVNHDNSLVPDDLGERIGDFCIEEMKLFAKGDSTLSHNHAGHRSYMPLIHPQPNAYHYDIMGLWQGQDQKSRIMFISFYGDSLTDLIGIHQLPGHHIYLVRSDQPDLIEIGAEGTRDHLQRRPRISEDERSGAYAQHDIAGTRWKAIGFFQPNLLASYSQVVNHRFNTNFIILFCFWLVSILILYRLHKHKKSAIKRLQALNDKLETIVMKRTHDLTKLFKAVDQSPVEVLITDIIGKIEYINPMFTRLTGCTEAEILGTDIRHIKSFNADQDLMLEMWDQVSAGGTWQGELQNYHKNGNEHWIRLSVSPVRDSDNKISHFIGIGEDITQKRIQEEQIRYQAQYDALTGLPNRVLAQDRLEQAIRLVARTDNKVALIFVDLDDFKKVNDTLGHDIGDTLIYEAAQRLKSAIRGSDTVARIGGDEFLIIVQQINNLNTIETIANNIIEIFNRSFHLGDSEFIVTASLGITLFPDDGTNSKELMRAADLAMYQSKLEGKNTHHFFSPSMDEATREYSILEQQLHNALDRREFHVVFQPIVRLSDEYPVGCEALIRWYNPELGTVEPERFIPVAEQTGLIISIGEYVLRQACKEIATWNTNHEPQLFVAVNLSPRQFWYSGFNELVTDVLQESGLSPDLLELEITESMIIRDHRDTEQIIQKLNTQGIKLAMDDFGTGYSSLYQLKSFPFDKLKIDRSFVQDLETDSDDDAVVRAAVALAHGLDLEIVAEGIENENQRHILTNENCQYGQGYLFSRPVNAEKLNDYLRKTFYH